MLPPEPSKRAPTNMPRALAVERRRLPLRGKGGSMPPLPAVIDVRQYPQSGAPNAGTHLDEVSL
jgi:hypothetical protein